MIARARNSLDPSEFLPRLRVCLMCLNTSEFLLRLRVCLMCLNASVFLSRLRVCVEFVVDVALRCGCVAVVHYVFKVVAHNTDRFEI